MTGPHDLPQPREGIVGSARDPDGLLSLADAALPYRDALIALTWHLTSATMVGHPAPVVADMDRRMRRPQPGDFVLERTLGWRSRDPDTRLKAFGLLLARRTEWACTDAEWAAEMGNDPDLMTPSNRATADAWYVQYGPDPEDVCRWANCEFVMVPVGRDAFKEDTR